MPPATFAQCVARHSLAQLKIDNQSLHIWLFHSQIIFRGAVFTVNNRSGYPARSPGLDFKLSSFKSNTHLKYRLSGSGRPQSVPLPFSFSALMRFGRRIGSNRQFHGLGYSIYGRI